MAAQLQTPTHPARTPRNQTRGIHVTPLTSSVGDAFKSTLSVTVLLEVVVANSVDRSEIRAFPKDINELKRQFHLNISF
jgi:hypothetical protein